jgi:acetyl-CoA C-acetyltransferase
MQLEDLGFCEKGQGGKFVADGNLISGVGKLPFNTDGGGLCNNHPDQPRRHHQGDRGGAPAARRGPSQGAGAELRLALAHGTGGSLGTRHGAATLIMEREPKS